MISAERLHVDAVHQVDRVFADVLDVLLEWTPALAAKIEAASARRRMTGPDLVRLIEADAVSILTTHAGRFHGAGFCADSSLIESGNPLAWWQGKEMALLGSTAFDGDQVAIDLRRLEWYRVPQSTGRSHVAGPYVDYLCSNEITITSANPVVIDGQFVGVACIDILVADLEDVLAPYLGRLGRDVSLVNSASRVVMTNDSRFVTGDIITELEDPAGSDVLERTDSRRFPFSLVRIRR